MKQLDKIESMLGEHIKKSAQDHLEVKQSLARLEVKMEQSEKTTEKHEKEIASLNKWKWMNIPAILGGLFGIFK